MQDPLERAVFRKRLKLMRLDDDCRLEPSHKNWLQLQPSVDGLFHALASVATKKWRVPVYQLFPLGFHSQRNRVGYRHTGQP